MTSEVPIYKIFSDDSAGKAISDHQRSVMDDLVSDFYRLFSRSYLMRVSVGTLRIRHGYEFHVQDLRRLLNP